jgi:hypothetical protein
VAAALAIKLARQSKPEPKAALARLQQAALDLGPAGFDPIYGFGFVQLPPPTGPLPPVQPLPPVSQAAAPPARTTAKPGPRIAPRAVRPAAAKPKRKPQ